MKRGNTALKRVVSVASVAAMAIAGAVLAAPAASAATLTDPVNIRATPIADAGWISGGSVITKVTDYNAAGAYGDTGAVPVVGVGTGEGASGMQVFIPAVAAGTAFEAGDEFTVTLTGDATFTGTPTVDITRSPINGDDLVTKAGWAGSNTLGNFATEAGAATATDFTTSPLVQLSANRTARISGSVDSTGKILTVTLNQNDPNTAAAAPADNPGYLVSISNVNLTVKDGAAPGAVKATAMGGGSTTIAYISPFTVSIGSSTGYPNTKGDVQLPTVTVTETSKAGFADAATYGLLVTGTAADSAVPAAFATSGSVAPSSSVTLSGVAAGVAANGTLTTTNNANDTDEVAIEANATAPVGAKQDVNKIESLAFKGLEVTGLKSGADVTLTLVSDQIVAAPPAGNADTAFPNTAASIADGPSVTVKATTTPPRLAGTNRYATAADIAAEYRQAEGASNAVVLANGIDAKLGIDALAANYLAGAKGAAILLTDSSDTLPQATQDALVTLLKGSAGDSDGTVTIYVMGKTDSVSDAAVTRAKFVAQAAVNTGVTVKTVRFDGDNRYETAAKAVTEAGASALGSYNLGSGSLNTAFLASGSVNADALAAGALSAGAGIPVLLTDGKTISDSIAKVIKDQNIKQLVVLGSTDRVSDALVDTLKADNGVTNVVRVAGTGANGRYDTAADLNTLAFKAANNGLGLSFGGAVVTAYLANGTGGFADALTVGPLAGLNTNPLLTVPADTLPSSTKAFLTTYDGDIDQVTALGQSDRIEDSVIKDAQAAIGIK